MRQVPPPIQKDGAWATPGGKLGPNAAASAKAGGTTAEPGKSAIEKLKSGASAKAGGQTRS
eukprot:8213581-Lingulodinium_polyedra.AAC.1